MVGDTQAAIAVETQTRHEPDAQPSPAGRLASLDAVRGLAVMGMILVVGQGSWEHHYSQLGHADWYGWTLADTVFPLFLFAVGIAIVLSSSAHLARGSSKGSLAVKILRRSAVILVLGLALNAFPTFDLPHLRIPGILQRIAVCYAIAGLLFLAFWRSEGKALRGMFVRITASLLFILILYWALLAFVPVPMFGAGRMDSFGSLPAYLDRQVFSLAHLWPYGVTPGHGVTYDPEGILSTLTATATVLIGVLCGLWLKMKTSTYWHVVGLAGAGLCLFFAGVALNPIIPIAKKIWTDSFVLVSGGFAMAVFAAVYWLCDVRGLKAWSYPLRVLGSNAILAFTVSQLVGDYLDTPWAIRTAGFAWLHAIIPSANAASFVFALVYLLLIVAMLAPLHRRRIFLRV
jgi:predicted acyltransferase